MRAWMPAWIVAAALLAGMAVGCSSGADAGSAKPSSEASSSSKGGGAGDDKGKQRSGPQDTVQVSAEEQKTAGIRVVEVEPRSVARTLTVPGQVMMNEQRTAHVAPYSDGRVMDVLKVQGDMVRRGDVLARLHSHSVHETVGALAQDFANVTRQTAAVTYAQEKRDRYAHLYEIQAASLEQKQGSEQELVEAKTDLHNAQAAVTMEREHLGDLLQVPPESLTQSNLYAHELVPITSPIAGTVVVRSVTPGMVLEPGNEVFTVSDLSEVWVLAAVNEADLSHVRVGQKVEVRTGAWPRDSFPGTVTLIGSSLDPQTRTVQVRATLRNPGNRLKPQMYATVMVEEAETRQAIFVPEDALQEMNGVQVAFVTPDGTHFTPHALKVLPPVNGQVEVTDGLRPGDHVAVAGAFVLKSDLLKATIGEE